MYVEIIDKYIPIYYTTGCFKIIADRTKLKLISVKVAEFLEELKEQGPKL